MTHPVAKRQSEAARLRRILIESRIASLYKKTFGLPLLGQRIRLSAVAKMLRLPGARRHRVLDAGCGWGLLISELSRTKRPASFELFGLDLSIEALKDAQRLARKISGSIFHPVSSDIRFLPFVDSSFDGAVCSEVLEHVADDRKAIAELRRSLRLHGRLVVTVPNADQKIASISTSSKELWGHVREGYSLDGLRDLMEGHGLRVLRAKHLGNLFGGAAWEVSVRLLSLFRPLAAHGILEALTFPLFYGIVKLDSLAGERPWGKWLLLEICKQ